MLNLMKLELKKYKLTSFIRAAMIANIVIIVLTIVSIYATRIEGDKTLQDYNMVFMATEAFVRSTFMIFGAVLIAKFIIREFNEKTITVLFMYPVSRQKLMTAKLLIIMAFILSAIIVSDVITCSAIYVINLCVHVIPGTITGSFVTKSFIKMFMNAISATGISLIPLFFGMRKYSVAATIVSAVILSAVVSSSNSGVSVNDIIAIPIMLALIGIGIAYLTIRNIEKVDLMN
ncbi:ABC transporter permease [Microbacteriaceae bacterium 4G12]